MATSIGQRTQELTRLNPWWRQDSGWDMLDLDLEEAENSGLDYHPAALDNLLSGCLYILRGPRRVGKTVAVKLCIQGLLASGIAPARIVRIAADGWSAKELRTVVQNIALPKLPAGQTRYWFIDEITAVTGDWAQQIKWLRDNDPEFARAIVVLTGSDASALTDATGTLAGRRGKGKHLDRLLMPMGFRTFVQMLDWEPVPTEPRLSLAGLHGGAAEDKYHELLPWIDLLTVQWELYLAYGGFPRQVARVKQGAPIDAAFVDDLFAVVFGDVFKNSRLSQVDEMRLLERLWTAMAAPVSLTSVAMDLDVSKDTIRRHVEYLRNAYLLWSCPQKASDRWLAKKGALDKLYAVDPLIARLAHLQNPSRDDVDLTVLSEMQLGMAVRRRIASEQVFADKDDALFYYRSQTGKEIDYVSGFLSDAAIESKYVESGRWASESQTLNASAWKGVFATKNVLDTNTGPDRAWAVPTSILAYLIDT